MEFSNNDMRASRIPFKLGAYVIITTTLCDTKTKPLDMRKVYKHR